MTALLVFLGSGLGAVLRHCADRWVTARAGSAFPFGVLLVNVVGCFALGLLLALVSGPALTPLGTGVCGGLTTFSTFSADTVRLVEQSRYRHAALNVLANVVLGVAVLSLGHALGHEFG
ncbi:fluoride efflux transporter CrcB [Umezawaea beigongshangensis]|uniref:fluoride efflux transporter CrcB n=1 Tax=Umezawaea beigongshangensis TaxID=2780383 RepID=UPI0018F25F04|nr:fluoride efflux transporter CrcB [Umezawaea beigongshangensis]